MIIYKKTKDPIPKNERKPITSVTVVTKTLDAKAGSIFIFFNATGIKIPNKPATIIFKTIDAAIIIDRSICLNHSWTTAPVIIANIIPFRTPIKNSLPIIERLSNQTLSLPFYNGISKDRICYLFKNLKQITKTVF